MAYTPVPVPGSEAYGASPVLQMLGSPVAGPVPGLAARRWAVEAAGWAVEAVAAAAVEGRRRSIGVGGVGLAGGGGRWRCRDLGGRRGRRCRGRWVGVAGWGSSLMWRALGGQRRCSVGGGLFGVGRGRECPG